MHCSVTPSSLLWTTTTCSVSYQPSLDPCSVGLHTYFPPDLLPKCKSFSSHFVTLCAQSTAAICRSRGCRLWRSAPKQGLLPPFASPTPNPPSTGSEGSWISRLKALMTTQGKTGYSPAAREDHDVRRALTHGGLSYKICMRCLTLLTGSLLSCLLRCPGDCEIAVHRMVGRLLG